ncbi:AraC family transcriptional regulator [Sphingobacterium sp. SRCM116780]|uniref:AraC family transcriptional regulator n=1 Tax=Sphingobacterium sp. SRCM116780 TaxID=2907623 RepID=UPI001F3FD580|nr:AraC family transcriptional regulator [Sphingobacterium sp. SRCM116780]UIR57523.1 AraC family transcriptional regulator [Sphingobacterium sp. SRCM116780]
MEEQKKIKEGFLGQRMIVLTPNIRKEIKKNPLINTFYLTAIGYYPNAAGHDRERKTGSNEFILLYCMDGEGRIDIQGKTYQLKANMFFIVPKNIPHRYYSHPKHPWSIYWLHFSGSNASEIYQRSLIDGCPLAHSVPFEEYRVKQFNQIFTILEHSFSNKDMEIMNFRVLHFVTSLIYYKEINPAVYSQDAVSSSINFMKSNLSARLSVHELSDQQKMSLSQYLRIFKQKTGQSPIAYFNQLKIQHSCQYLYFTDKSIKEICLKLGIDDQYYFSRLFNKLIGVAPSMYRKMHKK